MWRIFLAMFLGLPLAACIVACAIVGTAFISGTTIPAVPSNEAFYWPCSYAVRAVNGVVLEFLFVSHLLAWLLMMAMVVFHTETFAHESS